MAFAQERYFRQVTATVLGWYNELETGVVEVDGIGRLFLPELLHYRIDIEKALKSFTEAERKTLMSVHVDGLTMEDAVRLSKLAGNPKTVVVALEVRAGRIFERLKLNNLVEYVR